MRPAKFLMVTCLLVLSFHAQAKTILFLGDSLTEGYTLDRSMAFPEVVKRLAKEKLKKEIKIINGGVSGSTSSSGLARLKWYLKKEKPDLMLLALGANDGLRGLDLTNTKANLLAIVDQAQQSNVEVILAGMLMPPNYGPKYTTDFKKMFEDIAHEKKIRRLPFLLERVAGVKSLNLADGIHPNEEGYKIVGATVFEFIKGDL